MAIGALFAAVFIGMTILLAIRRKKLKNNEDKGKYVFQYVYAVWSVYFFWTIKRDNYCVCLALISDLKSDEDSYNYDSAYVNTIAENRSMPEIQNNDIIENPYYETIANEKSEKGASTRTEAVNFDHTDVVTATRNIYYS